jgi:hypothetical protein
MTQITIAQWLSSVTPKTTPTGASMLTSIPKTPQPLSYTPADYHMDMQIATMNDPHTNTLWGRIIYTAPKYIAIGYNGNGDWMRITCSDLSTAVSHIGKLMTDRMFLRHIDRQARLALAEAEALQVDK